MGMVVNIMMSPLIKAVDRKEKHGHILNYPLFVTGCGDGRYLDVSPDSFYFDTNEMDASFDIISNVSWEIEYD